MAYGSLATRDEKLWSMAAHLLALVGYVVGVGQYLAPLVLFLIYRQRSKFIAFHALQSLFFQLLVVVAVFISLALKSVLIGFLLLPLVVVAAAAFPLLATYRIYKGEEFEYPLVGRWARQIVGA